MSRIFLTGASGFLGGIISENLKKCGNDALTFYAKTDIRKPFDLGYDNLDYVIHIAAKAHSIPKNDFEAKDFYDVNFNGTVNLCYAIDKLLNKPRALIFISTVAVYGIDSGERIKEDFALNGNTPYAKSKILAEEYVNTWGKKNNINIGILRLPLVAGPEPPGNLGSMIKGIRSGRYFSIGEAKARKSIVWGEDVAKVIPRLVNVGGVFNLTDGYNPTIGELEKVIANKVNKSLPIKIPLVFAKYLGRIGDFIGDRFPVNSNKVNKIISTLTFDDSKARNLLHWRPISVIEELERTL